MKKILLVLFSFLLLITSGCGQNTDTPEENSAAAYVVTDDKGRQVKIAGKPVRIVVILPVARLPSSIVMGLMKF